MDGPSPFETGVFALTIRMSIYCDSFDEKLDMPNKETFIKCKAIIDEEANQFFEVASSLVY